MRKPLFAFFLTFLFFASCAQPDGRIKVVSITPGEITGQDYSSWLSDNLEDLVPNCWNTSNFKYVDITLQLEGKSNITKLSLYDYEGVFTDNPATIYALNDNKKTLIGTFTGEQYKVFVDLIPVNPVIADAIVIHKYCNNIPEKIKIFGSAYSGSNSPPPDSLPASIITFNRLVNKTVGDTAFNLVAYSNNNISPISFTSLNPAVVSVSFTNNRWLATVLSAGSATILAIQRGNDNFSAAADVSQTMIVHPAGSVTLTNVKIPIDPKRWFQLTNASNGLEGLFDGKTDAEVHTGWGKILSNYDSYYPVLNGEQIDITGIRMYDGAGYDITQPVKLSVITSEGQKITVATFTGSRYNEWVGPDPANPSVFNLQTTFSNIRYLVINSWNNFPAEIEIYGNYTPGKPVTAASKKTFPLRQMFGINGFEWNFEAPNDPGHIDDQHYKAAKTFTGFRHYMDWEKLESSKGSYTFNPTFSGGWNYDVLYDSCKAAGIEVLACLKTLPGWMLNSYPADQRDAENVPVLYGKDFTDPSSYIEQAKVAFQYAARYGSNKNADRSLLSVNSTPRWQGDMVNIIKVGLGTVRYIECDNERDKWWKGRKAYQTAYEYSANLSAFYDGNKNTMGPGVGIKNADPAMKVVMAGTALATTDYLKGMVDWCRQHRGYKADGTVNLCWDVINYHLYSTDSKTSQNGNATRGAAPEISGAAEVATDFINAAHQYANDMPVWITEAGYDINQGSPFKAIPIGNKSALQTQADWILRSCLLYARTGIERVFFYELYDDNPAQSLQFSSSGLINANKTRKPAADYIYQANNLLGQYVYQQTINNDPVVDRYTLNGNNAYVIVVPDEKGRTAKYSLNLGNASAAKIYTPKMGSNNMDVKTVAVVNGHLNLTATETPVFIMPVANETRATHAAEHEAGTKNEKPQTSNTVSVYPNPVSDLINIIVNNKSNDNISMKIFEAQSGKLYKNLTYNKPGTYFYKTINTNSLPAGNYVIEIIQDDTTTTKKFIKRY